MRPSDGNNRKKQSQREEKIRNIYNKFHLGANVTFLYSGFEYPIEEQLELVYKNKLKNEYYFLCMGKTTKEIYFMKLVFQGRVKMILISEKKFSMNKKVFNEWLSEIRNS